MSSTETYRHPPAFYRNYSLFVAEGGLFYGAIYFTNHQTLLPSLILEQSGPGWLAALAPSLMVLGMFAAPIFTHQTVAQLKRFHPFSNLWSFLSRVVYLLAALLLFRYASHPIAIVLILAITPLISGIFSGIPLAAWQQLFMQTIPANRRSSNLALRFLVGGSLGIFAGKIIEQTLATHSGATGYAWLHLWAAVVAMLAWIAFAMIRESQPRDQETSIPKLNHLQTPVEHNAENNKLSWIALLRDSRFQSLWIALILMHTLQILVPFYAVGLRMKFQQGLDFLGTLTIWQMVGFSLGNLAAGYLGDKWSGRWVFRSGLLFFAISIAAGVLAPTVFLAKASYFAFGFFMTYLVIGKDAYILEIAPDQSRSLFLSVVSLISMISLLVFSLLSYLLWSKFENILLLSIPLFVALPVAFLLIRKRS